MFEVPAGGRRFRALELLVKQKRMTKTQLIPCVVREGGLAEEDSLAENVQRAALHPLDQFRAFQTLRGKGLSEEDIAARFFVSPAIVKQRLKLAAVSDKLLEIYADDAMTLEQLMAFTVTNDHARQEQVWEMIGRNTYNQEPYYIRRQLTEGAVRASDKRARFVGVAAYETAGGAVMRDLFHEDDGGWLQEPGLLDRLATEKLQTEAETLRAEGWKWISIAPDFPNGHTAGLRRLYGDDVALTAEEQERSDALQAEYARLHEEYAEAEEWPDAVAQRLEEIESTLEALDNRPSVYNPADIARAGIFLSIDPRGDLRIDRAYVRPEDEARAEPVQGSDGADPAAGQPDDLARRTTIITIGGNSSEPEPEEDDGSPKPLSDRLVTELTAERTLALRDGLANDPDTAFIAVLYTLCLGAFHRMPTATCLEISARSTAFGLQAPGLRDTASARAIEARHQQWEKHLPRDEHELWTALVALDSDSRAALFAHCASLTVNAVHDPATRSPARLAHADTLAHAINLDLAAAGWSPTVANYLGRVPKARILEAVREAKGDASAQLIDHLKKPDMAKEAERLLADTGWLPEPLRTPDAQADVIEDEASANALPAFLADDGYDASDGDSAADHAESEPRAAAA